MNMTTIGLLVNGISWMITFWVIYQVWEVNRNLSDGGKLLWTFAALVFGFLAAIAYYFTEKNKRSPEASDTLV